MHPLSVVFILRSSPLCDHSKRTNWTACPYLQITNNLEIECLLVYSTMLHPSEYMISLEPQNFLELLTGRDVDEEIDRTVNSEEKMAAPDQRRDPPGSEDTTTLIQLVYL